MERKRSALHGLFFIGAGQTLPMLVVLVSIKGRPEWMASRGSLNSAARMVLVSTKVRPRRSISASVGAFGFLAGANCSWAAAVAKARSTDSKLTHVLPLQVCSFQTKRIRHFEREKEKEEVYSLASQSRTPHTLHQHPTHKKQVFVFPFKKSPTRFQRAIIFSFFFFAFFYSFRNKIK